MNTDVLQLLNRFCAQAAKARSLPESLPAGCEIFTLPPEEQRWVVLALFGCIEKGVADYFSKARWGTGNEALKHANEEWAIERLFKNLALKPLPMTDHDFCAILATKKGYPDHGDYLLTLIENALDGAVISPRLKRWLGKVREATQDIYEGFPRGIEKQNFKAEMERLDALIHRPDPPRSRKAKTRLAPGPSPGGRGEKLARRVGNVGARCKAIIQDLSRIPQSWELTPLVPSTAAPRVFALGTHSGVEFQNLRSEPGAIYEDGVFDKCRFAGGVLSPASENEHFDPAKRCTVRRLQMTRGSTMSPIIGPVIFEDMTIDRLDTEREPLFVRGAAFKHVTLKGNIGRIMIRNHASSMPVERNDLALMQANLEFYQNVDWALDIREVRAMELSVTSVPVDLVRYDPEHQAVVRLTKIRRRWAEIKTECDGCVFGYPMGNLREEPYCDGVVLCVPLRAKKEKIAELIAVIKRLRKLGIADPC